MGKRIDEKMIFADAPAGDPFFESKRSTEKKPEALTKEHFIYLDELRESGVTNMFGARPYLRGQFLELTEKEAAEVLVYWMKTFGDRHKEGE